MEPFGVTLPRRAFLGARLPPDAEAFSAAGARVSGVVDGGMAAAAGVQAGDVIVALDGASVRSLAELAAALRRAGTARACDVAFTRGSETIVRTVAPCLVPEEAYPGQHVAYGALAREGVRLRTIVTRPAASPPWAVVLVVQGISCESIDLATQPEAPLRRLIEGWAAAGVATVRLDKRGAGDSEGGPGADVDFLTEVADFEAALAGPARSVDAPLFLFGLSVGGMIAALLAAGRPLTGVMVTGTSSAKWLDCLGESTRRQLTLRGTAPEAIAARLAALRAQAAAEGLNGRSAAYHRQLDAIDLEGAWRRVAAPVLILRGEHDWVVSAEEQAAIATLVADARVVDLPGLDHLLGWHASHAASLADYGAGAAHPAVAESTLEWIRARTVDCRP